MEEVLSGVYRMTLPLPFRGTNYLNIYILKEDRPAVIDTGMGDQFSVEKILSRVREAVGPGGLECIVTTHEHVEHFGGNKEIKSRTGAKVYAHEAAADVIEGFHRAVIELGEIIDKAEIPREEKERLKLIMRFNLMIGVTSVDCRVRDGDRIDLGSCELRVIYTPGHSLGHICLYDEDRKLLFTGDHVLGEGTPFVGSGLGGAFYGLEELKGRRWWFEGDVGLYIESLEKILGLDVDLILPAHGPVSADPQRRIIETLERKKAREKRLMEILREGRKDLERIVVELYGQTDDFYLIRGATLGYLSKLVKEGKARFTMEKGKLYFEPT